MVLDGVRRQVQPAGDRLRRQTTGDQPGDHPLAFGEAVHVGDGRRQFRGPCGLDEDGDTIGADERPAHDGPTAASGTNPGGGHLALLTGGRPPGLGDDGAYGDRQRGGRSVRGPQLVDPHGRGVVGHLDGVVRGDHQESGVVLPVVDVHSAEGGPAHAVSQRVGERGEEPDIGVAEVRSSHLPQERQAAPAPGPTDEHGAQLVGEAVRTADLALASTAIELATGRCAEAGRRDGGASEVCELVEIGLAELDFGQPCPCRRRQSVLDDLTGGQHRRRVDRQQAHAVEGDGPLEDAADRVHQVRQIDSPMEEPDDVRTNTCTGGGFDTHRLRTYPTPRVARL